MPRDGSAFSSYGRTKWRILSKSARWNRLSAEYVLLQGPNKNQPRLRLYLFLYDWGLECGIIRMQEREEPFQT